MRLPGHVRVTRQNFALKPREETSTIGPKATEGSGSRHRRKPYTHAHHSHTHGPGTQHSCSVQVVASHDVLSGLLICTLETVAQVVKEVQFGTVRACVCIRVCACVCVCVCVFVWLNDKKTEDVRENTGTHVERTERAGNLPRKKHKQSRPGLVTHPTPLLWSLRNDLVWPGLWISCSGLTTTEVSTEWNGMWDGFGDKGVIYSWHGPPWGDCGYCPPRLSMPSNAE